MRIRKIGLSHPTMLSISACMRCMPRWRKVRRVALSWVLKAESQEESWMEARWSERMEGNEEVSLIGNSREKKPVGFRTY